MASLPIVQFLSTNGDGTGTTNMNVDGSSTAVEFSIDSATDGTFIDLARLIIYVEDNGSFDSGTFGNGLALTNGITIQVRRADDSVVMDATPDPITQNGHWAKYCHDDNHQSYGQGNEYLTARWTFAKFVDGGINLNNGEKLVLTVQDDCTGLVAFTGCIQGHHHNQGY